MSATGVLFGGHGPQGLEKDERYTPQWVFDGLGLSFDTDPASPGHDSGDCVPATRKITKAENGLTASWHGLVWLNPPFSGLRAWSQRFLEHGNGVYLGPIANSSWFIEITQAADLTWLCADFAFTHPTHAGKRSSMPLFMASLGPVATAGLRRLAESSRHSGVLVQRCAALNACSTRGNLATHVSGPASCENSPGSVTGKPIGGPDDCTQ